MIRPLTVTQAVDYLAARGVKRKPATIRWWIRQGYLRSWKIRGRTYVSAKEVLRAERETRRRAMSTRDVSRETSAGAPRGRAPADAGPRPD